MKSELTQDELNEIFHADIRPLFDRKCERFPRADPVLVMLGGQPGAGKSRSMSRVADEYPAAVAVIGDDFRRHHPDYDALMSSPETSMQMPQVTAQAAGRWVEMSIEYLRDRGVPVVLETTMRQPDVVARTMSEFHAAGYTTEARVLSVPREMSLLGVIERYAYQVQENGSGRWASVDIHDAAYNNLPSSLETLVTRGAVDRVVVTNRGGVSLYDSASHGAIDIGEALRVISEGRVFDNLSVASREAWQVQLDDVRALLAEQGELNVDVWHAVMDVHLEQKMSDFEKLAM